MSYGVHQMQKVVLIRVELLVTLLLIVVQERCLVLSDQGDLLAGL